MKSYNGGQRRRKSLRLLQFHICLVFFYEVRDNNYVSRKTKCTNNSMTNYSLYLVKKKRFSLLHGDKVQTHAV